MKDKFKSLPMQKKMMFSYAVPVILLCALLVSLCYPTVNRMYTEQVQYSINQSCAQAVAFLDSYLQNMKYLSEILGNDAELQNILNDKSFGSGKTIVEEYRDFLRLRERLSGIELSNPLFRIGVYVPDTVFYSINHQFVYPESELEKMTSYDEMMDRLGQSGVWVTTGQEQMPSDVRQSYDTLVMYSMIFSAYDKEELYVAKVSTELSDLRKVLWNANVVGNGISWLRNESGEVLFSSNDDERGQALNLQWEEQGFPRNMERVTLDGSEYYAVCQDLSEMDWELLALVPMSEISKQVRVVGISFGIVGVGIVLVVLAVSWGLARYYVSRLVNLRGKMKELQEGNLNTGFVLEQPPETGDEINRIYGDFNYMVNQLRKLLQEHYRMGKSVKASELKALQAQINPHFLYNTLDLVNWMAMDYGAPEIAQIAYHLARFYRLSLNHGKNILTIEEELEHVTSYVEIENFHFDQAIHLEISVPEEIRKLACPNIILQPFVENSIVHGIAEFPEITECSIWIHAWREDSNLVFEVRDDGRGIPPEQIRDILPADMSRSSKGYGVKNINFRLKLYYGEKYGVSYEDGHGEGTTVRIRIPAMTVEETERLLQE